MKKVYIIVLLVILSVFLFVGCKKGEYKIENGKLYHFHYPGVGVSFKKEVKGGDLKTFNQIAELYGKDKNHAFYKEELLPNSDPKSFEIIDDIHSKDKNNVYWYSDCLSNADPLSYQIIDREYSKDKNYVFFRGKPLPNADPKTFEYIYDYYSKDKDKVFYYNKIVSKADPLTFEKITYYMWKDKNYVFCRDSILPNADPKTMKRVEAYDYEWCTDKEAVYHLGNRINVVPKEFEILSFCWGRSKTNYYYMHIPLPLDYTTAKILTKEGNPTELTIYIKDKNSVFYRDKKIEGADPKTFVVKNSRYAYDANNEYEGAEIIK